MLIKFMHCLIIKRSIFVNGRIISRHGDINWPPRSCDLTQLDFFCGATYFWCVSLKAKHKRGFTRSSDEILGELKKTFGSKENKLTIRRSFEVRKWTYGQAFSEHYNDQLMLSHKIRFNQDELIDEFIDRRTTQNTSKILMSCRKRVDSSGVFLESK